MPDPSITAYPLSWPAAWPRCHTPQHSKFQTSLTDARNGVARELGLLGARDVVISSNAELLANGQIAARQRRIEDTGVAVYFTLQGEQKCIPCDKWVALQDNLRAIELTINALRGLERWGAKEIVAAAFQGFQALPVGGESGWWGVLEVAPTASEMEVEAAYRRLAKIRHPDAGGDAASFQALAEAYRQAKQRRTS